MSTKLGWTVDAACRPNPAWTTDLRPSVALETEMSAICGGCPVRARCAAYALTEGLQGGFYAGVWIPTRTNSNLWHQARAILARRAKGAA